MKTPGTHKPYNICDTTTNCNLPYSITPIVMHNCGESLKNTRQDNHLEHSFYLLIKCIVPCTCETIIKVNKRLINLLTQAH